MAFEDAFPLFHQGPRSDLTIAYVHADIGASGEPTIDATKTSRGFNITRNSEGNYQLVFPKCKFCLPQGQVRPNAVATEQSPFLLVEKDIDATTGTVNFVCGTEADSEAELADGSEIVFLVLLGF